MGGRPNTIWDCWQTLITRHFQMCNSSASDCWNATSAIQDRPGVVTKRIWPTNVNAWWLLEARIYSDNLLQTLEGKKTMKWHFPARTHKPVVITVQSFEPWFSKGVLKRIFSFLMWDHFFNLACNSMFYATKDLFQCAAFFCAAHFVWSKGCQRSWIRHGSSHRRRFIHGIVEGKERFSERKTQRW